MLMSGWTETAVRLFLPLDPRNLPYARVPWDKLFHGLVTRQMAFCSRFVNTLNEMITIQMSGKVFENVTSHNASNYQFFPSGVWVPSLGNLLPNSSPSHLFLKKKNGDFNTKKHNLCYSFFLNRKHYSINTTEVAPNCPSDFTSSNLDFGSAYTYVVRRAVRSSSHTACSTSLNPQTLRATSWLARGIRIWKWSWN